MAAVVATPEISCCTLYSITCAIKLLYCSRESTQLALCALETVQILLEERKEKERKKRDESLYMRTNYSGVVICEKRKRFHNDSSIQDIPRG